MIAGNAPALLPICLPSHKAITTKAASSVLVTGLSPSGSQRKAPRRGRGLKVDRVSETLEGSCLTFTPNTTALHLVPMARRGRASFAKTRAPQSFFAVTLRLRIFMPRLTGPKN
jgi:hypothetical protein